jgi:hypothetical protein
MPPIDLSKLKLWFTISTAHWKIRRGVLLLPYCRGTFLSSNSTMHGGTLVLSWLQFFTSFHRAASTWCLGLLACLLWSSRQLLVTCLGC